MSSPNSRATNSSSKRNDYQVTISQIAIKRFVIDISFDKTPIKYIIFVKLFGVLTKMMYFCSVLETMTTTEAILNYATMQGGTFTRKGLLHDLTNHLPDINARAVGNQIMRLLASGTLRRIGRGEYCLVENNLPEFIYLPSDREKDIYMQLRQQFPFLSICIWSPKVLSSFMLHVPNIGYTLVDVERDGMEPVFHALQSLGLNREVLLTPSALDCERYLTGSEAVVVRQLIGQSPLTEVEGCTVPRIEKILVDAISDNELHFASGSEIYNIFESVLERNNINMSKLLRYASRRNRKESVEQIINTINHDKSKE